MTITTLGGIGGLGFALALIILNVIYIRIGLPLPRSGQPIDAITDALAKIRDRLKKPSMVVPAAWLFTTMFAAGLLAALWRDDPETNAWALVGFAGVLMLNTTFAVVESLRFGTASAAAHHRGSVPGLWTFTNVLGGFNQVFLVIALLGFSAAGSLVGFIPAWHAWLGYVTAAFLFISSTITPLTAYGTKRPMATGLTGRLGQAIWVLGFIGWASWMGIYGVALLAT